MAQSLYELDARGRMAGLTLEETTEFRRLDASLPYDGEHVWPPENAPLLPVEVRWLHLWEKHRSAVEHGGARPVASPARKVASRG